MTLVRYAVRIPGIADRLFSESRYPTDDPQCWIRYKSARQCRRSGYGYVATVTMPFNDWIEVRIYFQHLLEALETRDNFLEDASKMKAVRLTLKRISEFMD